MSDQSKLGLGQIITTEQHRDAVHIAVAPVVAGERLCPGDHVHLKEGIAYCDARKGSIGVVDPFVRDRFVAGDSTFWLFLYPGSITSLRHEWTHPAFAADDKQPEPNRSASETWMRKWATNELTKNYYNENPRTPDECYAYALQIGRDQNVGPNEYLRDSIDSEWWNHWANCTGEEPPDKDERYFSCSC